MDDLKEYKDFIHQYCTFCNNQRCYHTVKNIDKCSFFFVWKINRPYKNDLYNDSITAMKNIITC